MTTSQRRREDGARAGAAPRGLVLAIAALVAGGCGSPGRDLSELGRPGRAEGQDLLLVTIDTLRADHLGCYGHEAASTPTLDALAAAGLRFDPVTSDAPITLPSHSTIMTGKSVRTHEVHHNGLYELPEEQWTLAEALSEKGYATAAFIGAFVLDGRYGLAQGFDHYDDDVGSEGVYYNERRADAVTDAALSWLEQATASEPDRPHFTWVHYFDPHQPYDPPEPQAAQFAESPYDGEIAFVDTQVARLLDFLERSGRRERTLVVVTSDHGEGLGDHGEATHAWLIHDSTMRVPWIMAHPTLFPVPQVVDDRLVGLVDLMPTVLDLLGVQAPAGGFDGRNVLATPADPDRAVYIETMAPFLDHGWSPLHGLRRLDDKFILSPAPEYYDLQEDPGELRNLYPEGSSKELAERLEGLMPAESPARARERVEALGQEELERLRSLGYLGGGGPGEATLANPKDMLHVWESLNRASLLSSLGEHAQAVELVESVLKENRKDRQAWLKAVRIYRLAGDVDAAVEACRQAIELQPTADVHVVLAQLSLARRDAQTFSEAIREAQRLDPQLGSVYVTLGDFHAMQGRFDEALTQFELARTLDPSRSGEAATAKIERIRQMRAQGR